MILGDSLQVMASLAERENLRGKVQMIYIDPPYGIKFGSNWQVSTRKRDVKDGKVEDATREVEQITADFITWYSKDKLRMKYRRLYSAKEVGGAGADKYDQVELVDVNIQPFRRDDV